VAGYLVDRALSSGSDEEYQGPGVAYWVTSIAAELLLGFLASAVASGSAGSGSTAPTPAVPASLGAAR
jgi:hypothetical protein